MGKQKSKWRRRRLFAWCLWFVFLKVVCLKNFIRPICHLALMAFKIFWHELICYFNSLILSWSSNLFHYKKFKITLKKMLENVNDLYWIFSRRLAWKKEQLPTLSILSPTTKLVYNYRFLTCLLWLNNCGNN